MKRKNDLIPKIVTLDNLYLAYWKAKRGKEHKPEVIRFSRNLSENICELQSSIASRTVGIGAYHKFKIFDPKERIICAAPFAQRVLHHALMNVCGEIFDSKLIDTSCASRLGKGTYSALDYAVGFHRKFNWCLKLDVRKYFDSIDHDVLKRQLERMFKEKNLLILFNNIIDSYETSENRGLPIGNLTSQYFANHYLSSLDHFVKEQLRADGYVRYMDDILVYADDLAKMKIIAKNIREYLSDELHLGLKVVDLKSTAKSVRFLGYKVGKKGLYLSQRSKSRFRKKFSLYNKYLESGIWDDSAYKRHILPLISFLRKSHSNMFLKKCMIRAAT